MLEELLKLTGPLPNNVTIQETDNAFVVSTILGKKATYYKILTLEVIANRIKEYFMKSN